MALVFSIALGGGFLGFLLAMPVQDKRALASTDCSANDTQCLSDQIGSFEKKLKDATKKKDALTQDLNQINSSLTSTQQLIKRTESLLTQTTQTINQKEQEIANLELQLLLERKVLAGLIQELYATGKVPLVEVLLAEDDIQSLFQNNDSLLSTQEKMQGVIQDINVMRGKVGDEKASLEDVKKDHETLLAIKNKQKQALIADKVDTQSSIKDQQTIIAKLQGKLSKLKGDLNQLLGKSYSTDDVWKAVKTASKQTGVPKGILMGFLGTETHFAGNVGTGTYKTDMNPSQRSTFEDICSALGVNPSKMPVSRRVCYNPKAKDGCGGWGGAMGVAQFIPTTWTGYSSNVSSITGNSPANPWNLDDGITAMALKLKRTPGITDGKRSAIKQATCSYLGTCSQSYINSVLYWMDNYEKVLGN